MSNKIVYGYFGHHKCASTWVEDVCRLVCRELGLKMEVFYSARMFNHDLKAYIEKNNIDFIVYANANYEFVKDVENLVGFHVVRDPRDIVVSAYFSHLKTHPTDAWPELVKYRDALQNASKEEGLMMELEKRKTQFKEMMSWPENPEGQKIMEVKMEDLTAFTYQNYLEIFSFLGLVDDESFNTVKRTRQLINKIIYHIPPMRVIFGSLFSLEKIPVERLMGIIWENDFKKKTKGRKLGQEDTGSHYRKGVAGDWQNHLNDEHLKYLNEHYGDLMKRYKYDS
jgi:hypothetical protein